MQKGRLPTLNKPNLPHQNGKWVALCLAFSAPRSALGIVELRLRKPEEK